MGIFVSLYISDSVTDKEWEKVYEETLGLISHFPLCDIKREKIHGIDTFCLVPTQEDKKKLCWSTCGDYYSYKTAETHYMYRHIQKNGENQHSDDIYDAILGAVPVLSDEEREKHVFSIWGEDKTQGEPFQIFLLSVACLFEARLHEKIFTHGDITRGQLKKAVEIANKYLDSPIEMPDSCFPDRLAERIKKLNITTYDQISTLISLFLGTKDKVFGDCLRKYFSQEDLDAYWKSVFSRNYIGTTGFEKNFKNYMLWGFDFEKLMSLIDYADETGEPQYEKFINIVMDGKLHIKEKNCIDHLEIHPEEEQPYGIATLFAQIFLGGARNKKIDRYIPIDEIRFSLNKELGDKCDVNKIIDNYLKKERKEDMSEKSEMAQDNSQKDDPAEELHQMLETERAKLVKNQEDYDIIVCHQALHYKKGNTISPEIEEYLKNFQKYAIDALNSQKFKEFSGKDIKDVCRIFAHRSRDFWLTKSDWERIFDEVEKDRAKIERYYPCFKLEFDSNEIIELDRALILNDELYDYCMGE